VDFIGHIEPSGVAGQRYHAAGCSAVALPCGPMRGAAASVALAGPGLAAPSHAARQACRAKRNGATSPT
jgi:hypothetical protein